MWDWPFKSGEDERGGINKARANVYYDIPRYYKLKQKNGGFERVKVGAEMRLTEGRLERKGFGVENEFYAQLAWTLPRDQQMGTIPRQNVSTKKIKILNGIVNLEPLHFKGEQEIYPPSYRYRD